jgi:hypothetical protein
MLVYGAIAMMTQDIVLQQGKYLYAVEQLALAHKDLNRQAQYFHKLCTA